MDAGCSGALFLPAAVVVSGGLFPPPYHHFLLHCHRPRSDESADAAVSSSRLSWASLLRRLAFFAATVGRLSAGGDAAHRAADDRRPDDSRDRPSGGRRGCNSGALAVSVHRRRTAAARVNDPVGRRIVVCFRRPASRMRTFVAFVAHVGRRARASLEKRTEEPAAADAPCDGGSGGAWRGWSARLPRLRARLLLRHDNQ